MNAYRYSHARPEMPPPNLMQHVFLIATESDLRGPFMHRGAPLHAMQMVLVSPEDRSWETEGAVGPLPMLPQQAMRAQREATLIPREVTGEILRDANGKLYERVGDRVRPVSQLFAGARGEVIDLLPARAQPNELKVTQPNMSEQASDVAGDVQAPPEAQLPQRSFRELVRRLAPEPGFWRIVRYADFIDALSPQLAAAQRLQPGHQLACYVQVYELAAPSSLAALEQAASRELGAAGKLLPLSYDLCRRFGLSLPRPAFALANQTPHSVGALAPGARFITLRVALDPTVETITPTPTPSPTTASPTPAPTVPEPAPVAAKTTVPDEFGKPWEFRFSRDEAAYDMSLAASRGAIRRAIDATFHRVGSRDLKKWRALLFGKTVDQQLWSVSPPNGAFNDSRIRQWLTQTLQLGGYDIARMGVEWEIYWRRRGV